MAAGILDAGVDMGSHVRKMQQTSDCSNIAVCQKNATTF
jgi:hypothetical protein